MSLDKRNELLKKVGIVGHPNKPHGDDSGNLFFINQSTFNGLKLCISRIDHPTGLNVVTVVAVGDGWVLELIRPNVHSEATDRFNQSLVSGLAGTVLHSTSIDELRSLIQDKDILTHHTYPITMAIFISFGLCKDLEIYTDNLKSLEKWVEAETCKEAVDDSSEQRYIHALHLARVEYIRNHYLSPTN